MSRQTVQGLIPGTNVDSIFLVTGLHLGTGKTGKNWLAVKLSDATGELDGRIWDHADQAHKQIKDGGYLHVRGTTTEYMDKLQLKIQSFELVDAADVDPAEFVPGSPFSLDDLRERMQKLLDSMQDPDLLALMDAYLSDEEFRVAFETAPAAKSIHHACVGGLFAHTLSMMELADTVCAHYARLGIVQLQRDLVLVGVFLHDSGKVFELDASPGFMYTDEGRLLGHIYLGPRIWNVLRKGSRVFHVPN